MQLEHHTDYDIILNVQINYKIKLYTEIITVIHENLSLLEQAESVQHLLVAIATGASQYSYEDKLLYTGFRKEIMANPNLKGIAPNFIISTRELNHFWSYIKHLFPTYSERREFLFSEFAPLLDSLDNSQHLPHENNINEILNNFNEKTVSKAWSKALNRVADDPDGAITMARTILETVCKHILDDNQITYASDIQLSELYKETAKILNLAPEQHQESIFKQILGGCSGVVNGLGTLRNKLGDAHGLPKDAQIAKPRHSLLAVNLAGSMAGFLVSTYLEEHKPKN